MENDSILLITGGTGSFGNAVLDRVLSMPLKEIRIFSRDEDKQDALRRRVNNPKVKFYIGDIRDRRSVENVVRGVDYIFHAAALKQVPSSEFFPIQAVQTNILGTENVLEAAVINKVKKVITLSTDKAVYPVNAMGMSKALMEKVMIAKARSMNKSETIFCGTRYGNVMASRGSVIPLFIEQIKSGKPLTVTDPNMTRFMMTLDDAVDLVLYAFEHGKSGDIFVQKSPATSVHILAKALINLYDSKSDIEVIGTRHGEKLYETLINREEKIKVVEFDNYFCIPADTRDLNYSSYLSEGESAINKVEEYTSHNTKKLGVEETQKLLLRLEEIKNDL
ncbi:MAG: polysaccharide biosynthesis protein [Kordiimonadaceae bacterium]|jgi:UDP-N-acetylglucosamine 4,6-dehydratase/5-epimerase|nr:polysaccharide biosynthesis protein [Kordiimonadaceae bacterium]